MTRQKRIQIFSGILFIIFFSLLIYFWISYIRTNTIVMNVAQLVAVQAIEAQIVPEATPSLEGGPNAIDTTDKIIGASGKADLVGIAVAVGGVLVSLLGALSPFLLTMWADRNGLHELQKVRQKYEIKKLRAEAKKLLMETEVLKNTPRSPSPPPD